MRYAWFIVLVTYVRFLMTAVYYPPGDGDLAWQRWLGWTILRTHCIPRALGAEAFSAVGAPWTPQEWLFSIGTALGSQGWAREAFALLVAVCACACIVLVALRARDRGASPLYTACAAAGVSLGLLSSFGVRAQVVAWAMLALMLRLSDSEGPWLWAAVPVAAIWSNLHASSILAPLIIGATALGRALEDRAWTSRVRTAVMVTAATCGAICCNPFGVGLPLYAISLFHNPIKAYISEWKPSGIDTDAFVLGALPMLICLMVLGARSCSRPKISAADMIIFSAFTFLLFFAARNIAIFSIMAAPLAVQVLSAAFPMPQTEKGDACAVDRAAVLLLPLFVVAVTVLVGYGLLRAPGRTEITMPEHEVDVLVRMPGEHRILCADFAWCSYFVGKPGQRVFLDGRADPYPLAVWKKFASVAYLRTDWRDVLDSYRINAVVVRRESAIDQALAAVGGWKQGGSDEKFRLWVR